ncbi:TetR family transcriptional regulator [Loigolactobacillus coryniformis]|uniref:TetR family transcriptional regulator n=1 Tax=Loigolactobacillus coryniformis TaxID=1610 RepID=UPI00345C6CC6
MGFIAVGVTREITDLILGALFMGLRERKKALKRQEIVTVATALFEQKGFDKVTVAEIAR